MIRWSAVAYAALGLIAMVLVDVSRGGSAFEHPEPWLAFESPARHVYSALWGVAFGGLVVLCTRVAVSRFGWARTLHSALRPFASNMSTGTILLMAALSAFGEEMLFRGLLTPILGVLPQALLFGLAHQIRGPSRWVWVAWATAVGLALGCMFQLTGSLLGPLAAHALVNALNLAYLKSHDLGPRRPLGGLLGQQPNH